MAGLRHREPLAESIPCRCGYSYESLGGNIMHPEKRETDFGIVLSVGIARMY